MYASVLGDIFFSGVTEAPWYWALIISALISVMALLVSYFGVRGYNETYKSWKIFSDTENGTSIDVSIYQFGQKQPKWKMYCLVLGTTLLLTTILFACQRYKWQSDAEGHYEIVNLVMMLLAVLSIALECFTGDLALMWLKRHRSEINMVKYYRRFRYHLCQTADLDKRISMLATQLPNDANRLLLGDARKCIYRAEHFSTDLDNYLDPFQ
jgi:membrane protein implicated in regulation of membrane protease activity